MDTSKTSTIKSICTVTFNPSLDRVYIVPDFVLHNLNSGVLQSEIASGKGINISRYLACAKMKSNVFCFMGDNFRKIFSAQLTSCQIPFSFTMVKGDIRSNITIIDPNNNPETHIKLLGFSVEQTEQESIMKNILKIAAEFDIIVFAGSYPTCFDFTSFNELLSELLKKDIEIFIDNDGANLRRIEHLDKCFMKPNIHEFETLVGIHFSSIEDLITYVSLYYLPHRKKPFLLSLGKDGILFLSQEKCLHATLEVHNVGVISTTGCGDAVVAGFLYAYAQGEESEECLREAIAFAVNKLGGGQVGHVDIEEILKLKPKVKLIEYNIQ